MSAQGGLQRAIERAQGQSGGGAAIVRARARQKPAGQMNGLESRYAQRLDLLQKAGEVAAWRYEALTLKLAHDTRYTADFFVLMPNGEIELHECKGRMLPEGRAKLYTAAALYPWFTFRLVREAGTRAHPDWSVVEVRT